MTTPTTYDNIKASLFHFCSTFDGSLTLYYFDAVNANTVLPEADLIGIKGLSVDIDEHLLTIRCMVGVATSESDTNLFRLDAKAGALLEALKPGTDIPALNASTGSVVGNLRVENGTSLSPVYTSNTKPLKFVSITLATSLWV